MSDPCYCSAQASSLIELGQLKAGLGDLAGRLNVDAVAECGSTNAVLLQKISTDAAFALTGAVLVSDRQTAGRGRRGRAWLSAQERPQDSLTFSLHWRFPRGAALSGLSLAVGLALADALVTLGGTGIKLKWPNDLLLETEAGLAKLGGILIELASGAKGISAVIGIGLNLRPPMEAKPDQLAAGLDTLIPTGVPDRHVLFSAVLRHLVRTLDDFSAHGFAGLRAGWEARNAYAGQIVRLIEESVPVVEGRCLGVDDDGALLVETADGVKRWLAGDVSLRAV